MAEVTVNGLKLHYRDTGGDLPVVVLTHGFTGNSRNWALTVPALRDSFRVISPDHRGHGLSHKPTAIAAYELDALSDDLYGLLKHLGIERCYLVGHSMGGMVSQLFILDHPEMVRALVLVDTAAEVPEGLRSRERYQERQRLVRIAEEQGMEAVFDEQLKADLDPRVRNNPLFMQTWREQFLMTSREAYIGGAHGMASRRSLIGRLKGISAPTLVICGEFDEPFLAASRAMHEEIPGSEFALIQGAGHTPQIETPDQFNAVLTSFLDRVLAAATA
jgi:2-succinyl-6-hydroxy-2,4-cyclohexadiene-1-carboxylate synthase